jgi:signal transduction histidine kinase
MIFLNYILGILIPGLLFFLGLLVYLNNPKSATNKSFLLFSLVAALSTSAVYFAEITTESNVAFFWVKIVMIFGTWFNPALLLFIFTFPKEKFTVNKILVLVEISFSVFLSICAVLNLLYKKVEFVSGGLTQEIGPFLPVFGLFFLIHLVAVTARLIYVFKRTVGREKEQIRYLTLGFVVTLVYVGIFDIFFILVLGTSRYTTYGVTAFIFFEFAVFFAITRHRLMDIRAVVARTVAYTLLIGIIGLFYTASAFLITTLLFKTTTTLQQVIVYSALTLVVAFTFQPLKAFIEKVTDRVFYKERYSSQDLLEKLGKIMASTLRLDELTQKLLAEIAGKMKVSKAAFILFENSESFEVKGDFNGDLKMTRKEIDDLFYKEQTLIFDEMEEGPVKEFLRVHSITVSVPLTTESEKIGLLILGEKSSGEIYSDRDLDVLDIVASEIAVAVQNSNAFEEISKFNITLKEEIKKATHDLSLANVKLRELDLLKDEFVSVASHELRTPMTAIKSYLWMALAGRGGKLGDKLKKYLDRAYISTDRLIKLVNDMLNVSRIESGRIEFNSQGVDMRKMAEDVAEEVGPRSKELDLTVSVQMAKDIPFVFCDYNKIKEVLMNLIGNSLKFTPKEGKISVGFKVKDGMVEISVADNGVGISEEDKYKLFTKFGLIEKGHFVTSSQPAGSGLGLYISRHLVELEGGKIWAESEEGKGSTFTFSLPVATDKEVHQKGLYDPSKVIAEDLMPGGKGIIPTAHLWQRPKNGQVKIEK